MDPIDTLRQEHDLISRFIDTLATAVERLEEDRNPPPEFFDKSVIFASEFADTFHHGKEELVMFRQLAQKKNGAIDGRIEALRYQHDQGRGLVSGIRDSIDGYAEGDPTAVAVVRENGAAYVSLLRHHIYTEDEVFFPMAREEMTDEEFAALTIEFETERERLGRNTFNRFHNVVLELISMLEDSP